MSREEFEFLRLADLGPGDAERWRQLAQQAIEPNPFFEHEYLMPLARSLGAVRDTFLAVVRRGSDWVACLPVKPTWKWHHVAVLSVSTWIAHPLYTLLGVPLISGVEPDLAAASLIAGLSREKGQFAGLELLTRDGPAYDHLGAAIRASGRAPLEFARIRRAALFRRERNDYLAQSLSSRRRRELRREFRKLSEAVDDDLSFEDRAGSASAVEALIELEARSKLARRGTALAANEAHLEFFRGIAQNFSARGRFQLITLEADGQIVAALANLLAGDGIFCFKIAYDERFSRFSPGVQVLLEAVRLFHDETSAAWIDSCADANNAMINRLWSDRRELSIIAYGTGPGWQLAKPAIKGVRMMRNRKIGADANE